MPFSALLVTTQGLNALAEVTGTGATLALTKVEAGSGYPVTGDIPGNFTQLKAYVMDADSTSTNTAVLYQSTIRCNLTSTNAPKVFQVNELGVFASLNGEAPFLFAYTSTGAPNGDTIDPAAPIVKEYVLPIVYSTDVTVSTTISMTDVVGLHASTHLSSGVDPVPISTSSIGGLCPKTPNDQTQVLVGGATASFAALPLHGPTHVSTARDPVPVATTTATGLLPQLSGKSADVLRGDGTWGAGFLPGFVIDYAGYTAPSGWLLCDGQAYDRTVYAALYAALGGSASPWGQGNGSSTFNVPDLRGRVSVGAGQGATLSNRVTGSLGGEENHTLSLYELPSHNHGVTDPGHGHSIYDPQHAHSVYDPSHNHNVNDGGHAHSVYDPQHRHISFFETNTDEGPPQPGKDSIPPFGYDHWEGEDYGVTYGKGQIWRAWSYTSTNPTNIGIYANGTGIGIAVARANVSIYSAPTNISIYSTKTLISIQNTGGGGAHNNMQPFAVLNRLIHI